MRIFTKSLIAFALLCIAGVVNAASFNLRLSAWGASLEKNIEYSESDTWKTEVIEMGTSNFDAMGTLRFVNTTFDVIFQITQVKLYEDNELLISADYSTEGYSLYFPSDWTNGGSTPYTEGGALNIAPGTYYHLYLLDVPNVGISIKNGKAYRAEITFRTKKPKTINWVDIITNGDLENTDFSCFISTEPAYPGVRYYPNVKSNIGKGGSKGIVIESADRENTGEKDNNGNDIWTGTDWDAQFFVRLPYELPAGTKFKFSFDYKATEAGGFDTQAHNEPGQYIHWSFAGSPTFGSEWQTYTNEGTVPSQCDGKQNNGGYLNNFQTIAFNLSKNHKATRIFFDNFKFEIDEEVLATLTKQPVATPYPNHPLYVPEQNVSTGDIEINDTDPAIVAAKVALLSAITRAQSNEVRANKTKASLAALDEVINAGLAQLTAKPITVTEKVKKEVETKKELTFKTEDYCAAKWTEADKTFQWGQGGWNAEWTFMAAQDITGDVSEWTKLHLKTEGFTNSKENKLNIVFKENDGSNPPSGPTTEFAVAADESGNIDIDLAAAEWKCDRTKLQDLTIYGLERESTETYGQVTVSEAWLSKTEEKEVEETTTKMPDVTVASLKAATTEVRMAVNELVDRAPVAEIEVPAGWRSVIKNGTLEGDDLSCFFSKDNSSDPYKSVTVDYEGIDEHKAIVLQTGGSKAATDWEDQFFIRATEILPAGKKFRVEFDYRSDIDASGDSQCHELPGNYIHYTCIGSPNFKSDWQHYTFEGTVPSQCDGQLNNEKTYLKNFQTIAFNLSKTRKDVKFVFDNIQFLVEDPVTVIKGVETVAGKDEYYDLQGRRVAQPAKGLYIKNGKKVAIK